MSTKNITSRTHPLISVIMPVYNAEQFVSDSIEAILNQTYQNFELIIVDDASTDASWSIVSQYQKKHSQKIKAVRLRKNLNSGGDAAGNRAFQYANPESEFIARIDADDIAVPRRLEKQLRYMQTHPNVDVLGCSVHIINDNGEVVGHKLVPSKHAEIYRRYFEVHPMIHPTIMIRRSALLDPKNMYKLSLNANNDYLTFSEMISKGRTFANMQEKLVFYRVHDTNDSLSNIKRTFFNSLKTRTKMIREFGYTPSLQSWFVLLAQVVILTFIPASVLRFGYLVSRGMVSPKELVRDAVTKIELALFEKPLVAESK